MIHTTIRNPVINAAHPKIFTARITTGWYASSRCSSSLPSATRRSYSAGLSRFSSSTGIRPVNTTMSIGNFSGRRCVLKKCTVKMKPTASSASSLWMIVAMLISQPGRIRVNSSGNQSIMPVEPMTKIPQNTAK